MDKCVSVERWIAVGVEHACATEVEGGTMKALDEGVVFRRVLMRGFEESAVGAEEVEEDRGYEELLGLVSMQAFEGEACLCLHVADVGDDDRGQAVEPWWQ